MRYTLKTGKTINISDEEIATAMKNLELTKEEAVQMWLEDNDYLENEEQNALDAKAKTVKIQHDAQSKDSRKKSEKLRTVKVSDEKQALFSEIRSNLDDVYHGEGERVTVLKENKLIEVRIGEKVFKIDIIEQRPAKKK